MSYDCQTCGACCAGLDVLLTDAEADAFERDPKLVRLTTLYQPSAGPAVRFMKRHPQTDRCLALEVAPGHYRCRIYPCRPMLCRALQAGAPDCEQARARSSR